MPCEERVVVRTCWGCEGKREGSYPAWEVKEITPSLTNTSRVSKIWDSGYITPIGGETDGVPSPQSWKTKSSGSWRLGTKSISWEWETVIGRDIMPTWVDLMTKLLASLKFTHFGRGLVRSCLWVVIDLPQPELMLVSWHFPTQETLTETNWASKSSEATSSSLVPRLAQASWSTSVST